MAATSRRVTPIRRREETGPQTNRHRPVKLRARASMSIRRSGDQTTTNGKARKINPALNEAKRSRVGAYTMSISRMLEAHADSIEILLPTKKDWDGPKNLTLAATRAT